MKIAYFTLGCKVNQYETEVMREALARRGHITAKDGETPDVAVINTCTVTAESDRKSRNLINKMRREYPDAIIIAVGCMTEAFPEKAEELVGADIVFGNTDHAKIPILLDEYLSDRKRKVLIEPHETGEKFLTPAITDFSGRTRAYIKIEDGCNRFCSYCEIPYARGRVRSKSPDIIEKEADALCEAGYTELVLVGINLSAYGTDIGHTLFDAVDAASKPKGINRIRLGSLEPDHITEEILSHLKINEKFCPSFHLSLQSGCDATLKRMNRHYDTAYYFDLITRIRTAFSDASITTDVMVGFPGETEDEFNTSRDFVLKSGFSKCHVFAYSRRGGTPAARLGGQICNAEKARRSRLMIEAADIAHNKFIEKMLHNSHPVLVEKVENGKASGYTENYTRMYFSADSEMTGKTVLVKADKPYLDGISGHIERTDGDDQSF